MSDLTASDVRLYRDANRVWDEADEDTSRAAAVLFGGLAVVLIVPLLAGWAPALLGIPACLLCALGCWISRQVATRRLRRYDADTDVMIATLAAKKKLAPPGSLTVAIDGGEVSVIADATGPW